MHRPAKTLGTLLSLGLVWAGSSWADGLAEEWPARRALAGSPSAWEARPLQSGMSLSEAIARAQSRFPGKVVKAETKRRNGRTQHVVRIISDQGRVRTFRIDAQTGEFL
jgi:uncharacterized membrane protein YkoI